MKTPWEEAIRETAAQPDSPGDSTTFWTEFSARARMTGQEPPVPPARYPAWARPAAAAALLVLLAAVGWLAFPFSPAPSVEEPVAAIQARAAGMDAPMAIRSLDVVAPHSAVLIMEDQATQATVLWIAGLQDNNGQNGG